MPEILIVALSEGQMASVSLIQVSGLSREDVIKASNTLSVYKISSWSKEMLDQ